VDEVIGTHSWLSWAARCRIPEFTELAKKIRRHLPSIHATLVSV